MSEQKGKKAKDVNNKKERRATVSSSMMIYAWNFRARIFDVLIEQQSDELKTRIYACWIWFQALTWHWTPAEEEVDKTLAQQKDPLI